VARGEVTGQEGGQLVQWCSRLGQPDGATSQLQGPCRVGRSPQTTIGPSRASRSQGRISPWLLPHPEAGLPGLAGVEPDVANRQGPPADSGTVTAHRPVGMYRSSQRSMSSRKPAPMSRVVSAETPQAVASSARRSGRASRVATASSQISENLWFAGLVGQAPGVLPVVEDSRALVPRIPPTAGAPGGP